MPSPASTVRSPWRSTRPAKGAQMVWNPARKADIDMQGEGFRLGGGKQRRFCQPVFAVASGGDAGFPRRLLQKLEIHAALQEIIRLEMRGLS